jgi:hypothetical protein
MIILPSHPTLYKHLQLKQRFRRVRNSKCRNALTSFALSVRLSVYPNVTSREPQNGYRICACISCTFFNIIYPPKLGCGLYTEYYVLLTTEPATPVLYVVKLPVETASVWDCYLASYCTRANTPTYYQCICIFWLHKSSRRHGFPEVGRPRHHWQITVDAASDNQSAANAIENILLSNM